MGECNNRAVDRSSRVPVDTIAARIHVEWDPDAEVTPFGQLPFVVEFLKASGLFESFVSDCPLRYTSPNAPNVRGVLVRLVLSVLAGHKLYAHITTIRSDRVNPDALGMDGVASEDSVRRDLFQFNEAEAVDWLDKHLAGSAIRFFLWPPGCLIPTTGQAALRSSGRRRQKLQPQETGTPFTRLSELFHGQHAVGPWCYWMKLQTDSLTPIFPQRDQTRGLEWDYLCRKQSSRKT